MLVNASQPPASADGCGPKASVFPFYCQDINDMITVSKVITHVALVQKWVNDLLTRPLSEGVVGRSHMRARAEGGSRERVARSDPVIILMTPIS